MVPKSTAEQLIIRLARDRGFGDSPVEQSGFELLVPLATEMMICKRDYYATRALAVGWTSGRCCGCAREELHAAPLAGKRLLALWDAPITRKSFFFTNTSGEKCVLMSLYGPIYGPALTKIDSVNLTVATRPCCRGTHVLTSHSVRYGAGQFLSSV